MPSCVLLLQWVFRKYWGKAFGKQSKCGTSGCTGKNDLCIVKVQLHFSSWVTFSIQYVLYWCIISFLTQSYLSALRLKERLYPCPTSDATKGDKDPFSGRILKVLLLHLLGACEKYKQSIYWSMSAHVFCQITEFDCPPIICNPLVMSLLYRAQQFSGSTTG